MPRSVRTIFHLFLFAQANFVEHECFRMSMFRYCLSFYNVFFGLGVKILESDSLTLNWPFIEDIMQLTFNIHIYSNDSHYFLKSKVIVMLIKIIVSYFVAIFSIPSKICCNK